MAGLPIVEAPSPAYNPRLQFVRSVIRLSVEFRLEKWYIDIVSSEGQARIAYVARLNMGALCLKYASVLRVDGHRVRTESTLRGVSVPEGQSPLHWRCVPLGIAVALTPAASPRSARILDSAEGGIDWCCFAPRARVVFHDGAEVIEGTGYAELLTMTIPPWSLPWDSLRWGRAHVGERALVWLELEGQGQRQSLLFADDETPDLIQVDRERVLGAGGEELLLEDHRLIRQGTLGKNVLAILPDAATLFPGRLIGMMETKWLSRARIGNARGFAIHELVRWPMGARFGGSRNTAAAPPGAP